MGRTEQQQLLAKLRPMATEVHESSIWLSAAAATLLHCLEKPSMRRAVDVRQLLGDLGQLAQQASVKQVQFSHAPGCCQALPEHARTHDVICNCTVCVSHKGVCA